MHFSKLKIHEQYFFRVLSKKIITDKLISATQIIFFISKTNLLSYSDFFYTKKELHSSLVFFIKINSVTIFFEFVFHYQVYIVIIVRDFILAIKNRTFFPLTIIFSDIIISFYITTKNATQQRF